MHGVAHLHDLLRTVSARAVSLGDLVEVRLVQPLEELAAVVLHAVHGLADQHWLVGKLGRVFVSQDLVLEVLVGHCLQEKAVWEVNIADNVK